MIIKESYIKQIGPKKFRVFSEKARNMGTYSSRSEAKKRLSQIEYFKHQDSADDNHYQARGGDGNVPTFFRKNLDYGERDSYIKKLRKLKAVKSALSGLGLKKEAAMIGKGFKDLVLNALIVFSGLGGLVHIANESLEHGTLKEIYSDLITEEGVGGDYLDERSFAVGDNIDKIVEEVYSGKGLKDNEKRIAKDLIINANDHISFDQAGNLQITDRSFPERLAKVYYPNLEKIKERLLQILDSGYDTMEVGTIGGMVLSDEAAKAISGVEGFDPNIYNDNRALKWPRDSKVTNKGWTIGYGHLLSLEELKSGKIKLNNGKVINIVGGISEAEGKLIKASDLIRLSLLSARLPEDTMISRPMYDALTDLSFNIGSEGLATFVSSIKDSNGELSPDLFAREITGWTKTKNAKSRKGLLVRRISQLLIAKGVLLPEDPTMRQEQKKFSYSTKDVVDKYLKTYLGESISENDVEKVLKSLGRTPPDTAIDFINILKR